MSSERDGLLWVWAGKSPRGLFLGRAPDQCISSVPAARALLGASPGEGEALPLRVGGEQGPAHPRLVPAGAARGRGAQEQGAARGDVGLRGFGRRGAWILSRDKNMFGFWFCFVQLCLDATFVPAPPSLSSRTPSFMLLFPHSELSSPVAVADHRLSPEEPPEHHRHRVPHLVQAPGRVVARSLLGSSLSGCDGDQWW